MELSIGLSLCHPRCEGCGDNLKPLGIPEGLMHLSRV